MINQSENTLIKTSKKLNLKNGINLLSLLCCPLSSLTQNYRINCSVNYFYQEMLIVILDYLPRFCHFIFDRVKRVLLIFCYFIGTSFNMTWHQKKNA